MKDYFFEILYVFAQSSKAQAALAIGSIFFLLIMLLGEFFVGRLHLEGVYQGLEQSIISRVMRRYDLAAFGVLISSLALAFKCYRKDRRRLMNL